MRKYYKKKNWKGLVPYGANRVKSFRETFDRLSRLFHKGYYTFLEVLEAKVCFQRKFRPK